MFPYRLNNFCSSSVKHTIGNLIDTALNLQLALGNVIILIILILPLQEHSISYHLFMWSSISFINILQFLQYSSFVSLGRFICRYFLLHLFFLFLVECNCFLLLCYLLLYNKMNQLYIYIYSILLIFPPIPHHSTPLGHHRALS